MRTERMLTASTLAVLMVSLTGCGTDDTRASDPAQSGGSGSSGTARPSVDDNEQITPGGIAAIVLEHLGPAAVRDFVTYEQEVGSVSVTIRLNDATAHNFGVQVYSPEQAEQFGASGECPQSPAPQGESECHVLANGTTVTTRVDDHGFSDDNVDGMVISGTAMTPGEGGALALYESYDDTPAVDVADLEDLLTDPRLTWLTDPDVNVAGEDIEVKTPTG